MKILITIPALKNPGGVAGFYKSILPHFKGNHHIIIHTLEIGTVYDKKNKFLHIFKDQIKFIYKLIVVNPDIVHINPSFEAKSFIRDGLFLFYAKQKKNTLALVFFRGWQKDFEASMHGLIKYFFSMTYKNADLFLVLASEFKNKLLSWGISSPVHLATTTIDEALLRQFSINLKIKKLKNSTTTKLLFLSRLQKEKGIFETIDAVKLLLKKGFDITLSIAGSGTILEELIAYTQKNRLEQKVEFLGHLDIEAKAKAFENHHLYILPTSHGEGMPNSILEAMAFGLPVVTRPVGGIKDFFENGRMGYLSESTNPKEIADCLSKIILDKALQIKISAYNHDYAKTHFIASKIAQKLKKEYEHLAAL